MRGKIDLFGLDMQVNMLAAAGLRVTLAGEEGGMRRICVKPVIRKPSCIKQNAFYFTQILIV
jgi:hypothetical protein